MTNRGSETAVLGSNASCAAKSSTGLSYDLVVKHVAQLGLPLFVLLFGRSDSSLSLLGVGGDWVCHPLLALFNCQRIPKPSFSGQE